MKVLIVDDEKMLRIGLKMMIPWEQHGYALCGGAEDGIIALEMITKLEPDIVITDLRMPRMDGLELIQALKSSSRFQGKIVVLSNYDEYELVREALKLGAVDYLLKVTLKPRELLAALSQAAEQIHAERAEKETDRLKTDALQESYRLAKNRFLAELATDEHVLTSEVARQADELHLRPGDGPLFLVYMHLDRYDHNKWNRKHLLSFSIRNVIAELLTDSPFMEFADLGNLEYIALVARHERFASESGKMQLIRHMSDMLKLYLNLEVNLVVSADFEGLYRVNQAYGACKRTAGLRFYTPAPLVASACEATCRGRSLPPPFVELQDRMIAQIRAGDTDGLSATMEALLEAARSERLHPSLLVRIALTVIDCWEAAGAGVSAGHALPGALREALVQAKTAAGFRDAFLQSLRYAGQHAAIGAVRKYRKEVREVIDYLIRHLDTKITLEPIANHVNLNESHMSRLFKSETGKTIVNYLNELRMERARELLKNPDLTVKAVAEGVGIPDPFYFNRLFRRTYGQSPTDYKKSIGKYQNYP